MRGNKSLSHQFTRNHNIVKPLFDNAPAGSRGGAGRTTDANMALEKVRYARRAKLGIREALSLRHRGDTPAQDARGQRERSAVSALDAATCDAKHGARRDVVETIGGGAHVNVTFMQHLAMKCSRAV
jgi:hypothetical protein